MGYLLRYRLPRPAILLFAALTYSVSVGAIAAPVNWNGNASLNFVTPANWDAGFAPESQYDEEAVIGNGDAVFLNSAALDIAGLLVGGASSLEIQNGGALDVVVGTGTGPNPPGNITTTSSGPLFSGSLIVRSGGALTAAGTANLAGKTRRITGPTATFTAGGVAMASSHNLTAEITHSTTHSPLSTMGNAELGGVLTLEFNGVNPVPGNTWTVINAASVSGMFASTQAIGLPLGRTVTVNTSAGGNGQLVRATVSNQLVLSVNGLTGAVTMQNLSPSTTEVVNGYSITANGGLNPSGWTSFQDAGQAGWEESNPNSKHLSELNLNGSRNIGPGTISLGTAFLPVSQFGVNPNLTFDYSLSSGELRQGAVSLTAYTLVLQVDPATGQSRIINPTNFDVAIDGYSITSNSTALDANAWTPMADSETNWDEANATSRHLSELNLEGSRSLPKLQGSSPVALGALFDFDKPGAQQDLVFKFSLIGVNPAGDFNNDGAVDAADYAVWRDNLGAPAGTLANDSVGGPIGMGQYDLWQKHFGNVGGGPNGTYAGVVQYVLLTGSSASNGNQVPEPTTFLIAVYLAPGLAGWRRLISTRK